ncbi:MAG: DNA polymerase IV [Nitrospirota bacterium]|nr:DNA polymerase IV [Nitrospirota bacterium]
MRWSRQILFGDVDAMFASAAVLADPSLAGKPVAVGGSSPRGIIAAASYAARSFGVRSAMPTGEAKRLCPDLILVPPDRPLYQRLHEQMQAVINRLLPVTEWTSIDEFYAETTDMQSLYPDPSRLGQCVKDAIFDATGLRCTVALATGKTVAKVAADAHKPDGLAVIEPGTEAAFLAARPVRDLPGIGPKSAAMLNGLGIHCVGDLLDPRHAPFLRQQWGTRLLAWQEVAQGIDRDPVVADRAAKSLGHETTFEQDTSDLAFLELTIKSFLGILAHDLRVQGLAAGSFTVKLKDATFQITTRQQQFGHPLNYDPAMWPAVQSALQSLARPQTRYRLVGLSLSGLVPATDSLFTQRQTQAVAALDGLIERYGSRMVRLGGIPEE